MVILVDLYWIYLSAVPMMGFCWFVNLYVDRRLECPLGLLGELQDAYGTPDGLLLDLSIRGTNVFVPIMDLGCQLVWWQKVRLSTWPFVFDFGQILTVQPTWREA